MAGSGMAGSVLFDRIWHGMLGCDIGNKLSAYNTANFTQLLVSIKLGLVLTKKGLAIFTDLFNE